MQRAWGTGTVHDEGPMAWVAAITEDVTVAHHIRVALDAALAPDASIAQCQAGLLAIECATYVHGGDADLDPMVHAWIRDRHPLIDEPLRAEAVAALATLRESSALAAYWRALPAARQAAWAVGLDNLRDRLTTAQRKPDPQTDPRIIALGKRYGTAKDHLRVALVPYEVTDEPSVTVPIAPGLSIVVHYAEVGELEPVPVPIAHARAWKRSAAELARLAAKRTRAVSDLRTHILENDGFELALAFGNSSFTAGLFPYANLLLTEGAAPHGMLVAAPNAGTVVYHRILDGTWSEAAVEMVGQVREIYANSAQRISEQLWWWRNGKVIQLPYQLVADNVMIEPIDAFVNYVKRFA